jgi:hypothetical protein
MITITGYLHRQELSDIIRRWMYSDCRPSDSGRIFRLVHFNRVYVSLYLQSFAEQLLIAVHSSDLSHQRVFLKGDLKDIIVANPPYNNPRIEELIGAYRQFPGCYYRETPFYGILFYKPRHLSKEYVGSYRIKRLQRLAEKSARRIIDHIFGTIKKHAEILADKRALQLGIARPKLVTSPEDMTAEFLKAETRLVDDLKHGRPIQAIEEQFINDVAGVKVIIEDSDMDGFLHLLDRMENCNVIEKEVHTGKYNATNLIVSFRPVRERLIHLAQGGRLCRLTQARGWSVQKTKQEFFEFVSSGEPEVNVEIIVSNYQEMLESEIGRCMHEDRIIEQRLCQQYNSQLSRNIAFLVEYLFAFASSSRSDLNELPLKLWNRYLPDYFDEVLKKLFGIPSAELLD